MTKGTKKKEHVYVLEAIFNVKERGNLGVFDKLEDAQQYVQDIADSKGLQLGPWRGNAGENSDQWRTVFQYVNYLITETVKKPIWVEDRKGSRRG